MKTQFKNDERRGRGHAGFYCTELSDPAAIYSFSLCRASDMTFLGLSGWQSAEEKHRPDGQERNDVGVILHVGPAIVDCLDENENYRLTLYADGLAAQKASFSIAALYRSLSAASGVFQINAPKGEPKAAPEPEPAPEAMPEPAPEAISAKPNKIPLLAVGFLILALLAGGGAWWFMRQNTAPVAEEKTEPGKTAEPNKIPEQTAADAGEGTADEAKTGTAEQGAMQQAKQETPQGAEPNAQQAAPEPALSAREKTRVYLGGTPDAKGAMELTRSLLASPEGKEADTLDAAYRLLYFASRQGDVEASLSLAAIVDPLEPAWGSIPKNGSEAWSYYAKVAGERPEAVRALGALKKWLENEAAKGNTRASRWIEEIARENATTQGNAK
ncbi:MAG: hypothetical protein LBU06_04955 [Desulfovibrio sp.]|jgi:hypothetical protein|nr:hypothetical protein [Desulfovibrio sp.]